MTSNRTTPSRRRSLSSSSLTSTSPLRLRSPEGSWRVAAKRAHHAHLAFSPSTAPSRKWDAEFWRRAKRARRDHSPSRVDTMPELASDDASVLLVSHRTYSSPAKAKFPSTPADFHLYPKHVPQDQGSSRLSTHPVDATDTSSDTALLDQSPQNDLTHLRSLAFGELQRSVAESGEGLVRRMRDFEDSRSKSGLFSKLAEVHRRGRKGRSLHSRSRTDLGHTSEPDEDEDIQIYAGEESTTVLHCQKRAASLSLMDLDTYHSDVLSSPGATCASLRSADLSDDESFRADADSHLENDALPPSPYISPTAISFTPALSHTYSTSTNSSLTSLPLPPPFFNTPNSESHSPISLSSFRPGFRTAIPSSRTEKAIAALTLAMANGAGSLNDYEALRAIYQLSSSDECHVGELWH